MINKSNTPNVLAAGVSTVQEAMETHMWSLRLVMAIALFLLSTTHIVVTTTTGGITLSHINFFILMSILSITFFGYRNIIFLIKNPPKAMKFWILTVTNRTKETTDATTGKRITYIAHPLGWKRKFE